MTTSTVPHETSIGSEAGPVGKWAFWARCTCGWTHRGSFTTHAQAQQLADEHDADQEGE